MKRQLTPEDIASHYSAAMDSVNLINGDKSELMTDAEWAECISQNKLHLKIMIEKDFQSILLVHLLHLELIITLKMF